MTQPTAIKAIFLMLLCTIFSSTAQILLKQGANQLNYAELESFFYWPLGLGFLSLGIGAVLMMIAFRSGELSLLFPILSTSYVWVSLLSPIFFAEDSMNYLKWTGVIIILLSVSLLGFSSGKLNANNRGKAQDESGMEAAEKAPAGEKTQAGEKVSAHG